ncbi:hypothetical protein CU311_05965 [Prochlorococcus marinus str. MU1402]|uniref:hypothetical protein n=1 Tax=Prochlorococcus marinus TaxID=1219 RepID=UPI001ADCF006|nr:hypothetical protein [Prochlorococcus marinus]MBO8232217.1 hypothetical protein [Prochlorococcus marinus XMU1402]MBW3056954.1 hypothetical protein [Prochlorococcus marinus str. MU1402]
MKLKSEIAFSNFLRNFSYESDNSPATQYVLKKISFEVDPLLNFDNKKPHLNHILDFYRKIESELLLRNYLSDSINKEEYQKAFEEYESSFSNLNEIFGTSGSKTYEYKDAKSFWKDLDIKCCLKVIVKSMNKALTIESDESFEDYKSLIKHKKWLEESENISEGSLEIPEFDQASKNELDIQQIEFEDENNKYDLSKKYYENPFSPIDEVDDKENNYFDISDEDAYQNAVDAAEDRANYINEESLREIAQEVEEQMSLKSESGEIEEQIFDLADSDDFQKEVNDNDSFNDRNNHTFID